MSAIGSAVHKANVELPRERNKLLPADKAAHDWYRFVLSFPPHLVREYVSKFSLSRDCVVLDPFCGTGTTLVECKKLGIASVGVEGNPVACLASRVKTDWSIAPERLWSSACRIAERASSELDKQGFPELSDLPLFKPSGPTKGLWTLPVDSERMLLRNSISPLPLHRTLVLLRWIEKHAAPRITDFERLALAKSLITGIGNLHFGPEVGVGSPKSDAPVVSLWLRAVRTMVDDIGALSSWKRVKTKVFENDARSISQILRPASIDAVITSPPYPNEKDYTRTTRLESVLLGFISGKADLRRLKSGLLRSNTRGVFRADTDDAFVRNHAKIQSIASAIENRRIELRKTSGFERLYPRVTQLYFGGMARHLAELRSVLKPGAQLAYVVGDQASYLRVMIRTGEILAELASSLGYKVVDVDLFRTRLATATKEQLREEVVLLRWPG